MKTHTQEVKSGHAVKPTSPQQSKGLKTEGPISEKDEVKKAETRTRKALKDHL
ncbi:MAG TPA: hypothetical protein VGC01_04885 [Mucilaginibacter sp.]